MESVFAELFDYVLWLDEWTMELVVRSRSPLATKLLTSVTGLGSASAALVLLGLAYLAGWRREFRRAAVALAITGVVVGTLMATIQRPFPPQPVCLTDGAETVATSFPSGHAAAVAVYAMTARESEVLPFGVVAALSTAIAISRVYLGTHYFSDTLVGVAIGVLAFVAAKRVLARVDVAALEGRLRDALGARR